MHSLAPGLESLKRAGVTKDEQEGCELEYQLKC